MAVSRQEIDAAALGWIVRTGDPDFADWEAFTLWLEADARHTERYHALSADLAEMTGALPADAAPVFVARPGRRGWLAGAIAASLIGVLGYGAYDRRPQPYAIETAAGATRTVALADGSSIALNGGTRLLLDRRDGRLATVERGEALFTVRHDEDRPFRVLVGDDELIDVGTIFDVVRDEGATRVGVAEGALIFNPRKEAVPLPAGRELRAIDGEAAVKVGDIARESVGGWRARRLDYDGAPLAEVAKDLSRALGTPITAAPAIAARPFRGTIRLDGLDRDPSPLAALLGVSVRRAGSGWELAATP